MRLTGPILLLAALPAVAQIQESNLVDWPDYVGVEGGIRHRTAIYTNLAPYLDLSGVTDESGKINTSINACPSNQVVAIFTNGTINVSGGLTWKNFTTLRGNGKDTELVFGAQISPSGGGGKTTTAILGTLSRGDTNLSFAAAPTAVERNSMITISVLDDPFWVDDFGYEGCVVTTNEYVDGDLTGRARQQQVTVTSVTDGTNITFWPPIWYDMLDTPLAEYRTSSGGINGASFWGLEDMKLRLPSSRGIFFDSANNCWASNVTFRIQADSLPAIQGNMTHRIEIVHCDFVGEHTAASAIVPYVQNSGWRVENNIFRSCNQTFIVVGGGGGHAFLYNYTLGITNGTTAMIAEIGNHGAHPMFVLLEGNNIVRFNNDSIHGTSSHWTLLRNHIRGWQEGATFGQGMIQIDSTNWYNNVVGNVLGYPDINTNEFVWQYESVGDQNDTNNPSGIVAWRFGLSGYCNWTVDAMAKATTLQYSNYNYFSNAWATVPEASAPVTNSLFYASKPSYMGVLGWPTHGPGTSWIEGTNAAMYRVLNGGDDPPAEGGGEPDPPPPIKKGNSIQFLGGALAGMGDAHRSHGHTLHADRGRQYCRLQREFL